MRNIGPLLTANLAKQIILCSQLQPNLSVFFIDKERKLPQSSVIFIFFIQPTFRVEKDAALTKWDQN